MKNFSVTKNGSPLDPKLYKWDEKTKIFRTRENCLVLDFRNMHGVSFETGCDCVFYTGNQCRFTTKFSCEFNTGDNCTIECGSDCVFNVGKNCEITDLSEEGYYYDDDYYHHYY